MELGLRPAFSLKLLFARSSVFVAIPIWTASAAAA